MTIEKISIPVPESLDRNCPDCGTMMDVEVLVDLKAGSDIPRKAVLHCRGDCNVVSMTRKWPEE